LRPSRHEELSEEGSAVVVSTIHPFVIDIDDPGAHDVQALLEQHLAFNIHHTPTARRTRTPCDPFGDYRESPYSAFMTLLFD
jgi:hypothetical protein